MNLSGDAVQEAASFYKIPAERVLVVCDDISLAPGQLRLRRKGSAGGHNGLKSIIQQLGTDQFPRIKMGVGKKPHPDYDLAAWVLGRFSPEDSKLMDEAAQRAVDAIEVILSQGFDKASNQFSK
jgi:PTH1 family peptidyl-tRNA hydrolase